MDLTPPKVADRARMGNPLIERPDGAAIDWTSWTNITIESRASGLGPYQTRNDHYRITYSGGTHSNRPQLDLPFGVGLAETLLKRLIEYATGCDKWQDDSTREWHQTYIKSYELTKHETYSVVEVTVVHPYLD